MRIPFGKYKGKDTQAVYDIDYLHWLLPRLQERPNNEKLIAAINERITYLGTFKKTVDRPHFGYLQKPPSTRVVKRR